MEWPSYLDEYEKLVIRMTTPRVLIDNAGCANSTRVMIDSARKHGILLEAVQVLTDLNLSIQKAYISSDGRWFMDVFHVTDLNGNKLTDESVINYIQQSLGAIHSVIPKSVEGLTVLELTGSDRVGLLSEVFAVLSDLRCNVVESKVWTHNGRIASLIFVKDCESGTPIEDLNKIDKIEARLRNVLKGDDDVKSAITSVSMDATVTHTERRLHQLMFADRDYDRKPIMIATSGGGGFDGGDSRVEICLEKGYSVVNICCRDRMKLLFDVVCTLTDMQYVVFHATINTAGHISNMEFFIRHTDGTPISSEAEKQRVIHCLQASIERRSSQGVRLELCTKDRSGLLADVTRTFRENGLNVTMAEISTTRETTLNVFYVTDASGNTPDSKIIEDVRAKIGLNNLKVKELPRILYKKSERDCPPVGGVKKPTMTEALSQTLQAMHKSGCLNLADVVEDVKLAVKNKVPLVRSLTLNWVSFCIETSNKAVILKVHKEYVPICMECLNDGTPDVRDAAFSVLAAIAQHVGMRPLEKPLEKLDDVRKKKLSEMIGGSGGGSTTVSSSVQSSGGLPSSEVSDGQVVRRSAASMLSGKKPTQTNPSVKKVASTKTGNTKKGDGAGPAKLPRPVETEDVEPSEMSLQEIEDKVGSLIQADTITLLKSAAWKERLEAIGSFKEQVEGLPNLDASVEILVRLLCAVPGWGEKNVQVQQQVIDVISCIASTTSKFPKKCVVLCLQGTSERVADIKTRANAMKCLTTFCEAVGPGFVFERLYKIMKEHKNPKVLSEGLLWMVSAVDDFGISHLKLKDLIDFCKDIGLQSSAAATRNATIKLIGTLHKFVGPDIKAFLSDVKPALLSALDAEYEKNPYEGAAAAPKKIVKASDSASCASAGGFDGLPREDVSGMITPTLLKGLESSDWKVRLESIEAVNKILEEANKRIQPNGTGELFGALKGRLYDSNKNLIMATLSTISGLASAMGAAVEKSSKGILSDVLKCLGDNKKQMRECTLSSIDSWLAAVHLDKMIPYITAALTDAKIGAEGRKDLFDWLSKKLTLQMDFPDAIHLLRPAASSMTDKSVDVRKSAEVCFGEILRVCGQDMVSKNLRDIQGPALAIVIERMKPYGETFDAGRVASVASSTSSSKTGKSNGHADRAVRPGSKAASARAIPTKAPRQESLMSVQDITIQSQALISVRDSNKDERERIIVRRFKFEEPRIEQVHDLENDLTKYFREDLHRRLLSTDFKKQVDGMEMLQKALPSIRKEIIEVIDVLLRWFVLRICESNTSCLLKVLEFLPELFSLLKNEGYTMNEAEASIFLPCLMEKSGHNIEKVRDKLRELIKQIIHWYSPAKTFPYILEALRSRNNRTRIECADLVGYLLENNGAEIGGQLKSLQIVASLTSERDGELRKAALNTLATGYKILGDDIWRYVGKLTEAQRSMLDDRFKWKAREMDKRKEGRPGEARAALRRSVRDNGSDPAEQSGEVSRSIVAPSFNREIYGHPELHVDGKPISRTLPGAIGPTDWNEALDIIATGTSDQSVEGMKVICHELAQATNEPEGSAMDDVVKDVDRLVSCLATKVAKTFDFSLAGASSRSCKYVLNTLMQTFQNKRLAHAVKESTLDSLITELLLWLLDDRVPRMDDGSQLLKALNVLMLKILDNADRTSSFVVLINLLRPLDPARWPSLAPTESHALRNQKFSDLVVKCLIKLTKVLQSTIYEVDLDRILQSIHIYLQDLGMEEIRRRAGADDKPLRMVKTVLHELVKLRGTAIKGHLSMVPIDMEPQPIILAYIDLNLQTLAAARMLSPSGHTGQTHWGDSGANNAAPASHSADAQLKQELAAIFKKIGDKQTCTIGLYELYKITQLYPKVDIFAQLQNASEAFRTYIRDGLAQMEKNAAAGRTPSSVPLSTPPPSAMISPKLGPLSPINTNPFGDSKSMNVKLEPTNFSLPPPSYSEEDCASNPALARGTVSDQSELNHQISEHKNDRLPAGVTSGTLDAIRERMKSIQLAAESQEAVNTNNKPMIAMNGSLSHEFPNQYPSVADRVANAENSMTVAAAAAGGIPPMDEKALSGLQARMERLKSGSFEHL